MVWGELKSVGGGVNRKDPKFLLRCLVSIPERSECMHSARKVDGTDDQEARCGFFLNAAKHTDHGSSSERAQMKNEKIKFSAALKNTHCFD